MPNEIRAKEPLTEAPIDPSSTTQAPTYSSTLESTYASTGNPTLTPTTAATSVATAIVNSTIATLSTTANSIEEAGNSTQPAITSEQEGNMWRWLAPTIAGAAIILTGGLYALYRRNRNANVQENAPIELDTLSFAANPMVVDAIQPNEEEAVNPMVADAIQVEEEAGKMAAAIEEVDNKINELTKNNETPETGVLRPRSSSNNGISMG